MTQDRDPPPLEDDRSLDRLLREARPSGRTGTAHDDAVMQALAASTSRIQRRRRRRWQLPLSLAAVLVVGVGIGLNVMRDDAPRGEAVRGGETATVAPANEAVLSAAPAQFTWTPVAGAERYVVKLRDVQGVALWESPPVTAGFAALPVDVRERLDVQGTYLWQLEAETAAGRRVLGNYWFEVRR